MEQDSFEVAIYKDNIRRAVEDVITRSQDNIRRMVRHEIKTYSPHLKSLCEADEIVSETHPKIQETLNIMQGTLTEKILEISQGLAAIKTLLKTDHVRGADDVAMDDADQLTKPTSPLTPMPFAERYPND